MTQSTDATTTDATTTDATTTDATDLSHFKSEVARRQVLADYDDALSHWTLDYSAEEVSTASGTTHFLDCGPREAGATPLVLLHGGGGNATMWGELMPGLAKARRVVALDILGECRVGWGAARKVARLTVGSEPSLFFSRGTSPWPWRSAEVHAIGR